MVIMCYAVKLDPTVFNLSNFFLSLCVLCVCVCVCVCVSHLSRSFALSICVRFQCKYEALPNDIVYTKYKSTLPQSTHTSAHTHTRSESYIGDGFYGQTTQTHIHLVTLTLSAVRLSHVRFVRTSGCVCADVYRIEHDKDFVLLTKVFVLHEYKLAVIFINSKFET